jgi:hypothetical protein
MPTDPSKWEMVDDVTVEVLRQMTPEQRLGIAFDLFRMAQWALQVQAENDHPDWTAEQVSREVARQVSLGVVPPGCELADWLRLHAAEYDDGPWTADECLILAARAGRAIGWDEMASTTTTRKAGELVRLVPQLPLCRVLSLPPLRREPCSARTGPDGAMSTYSSHCQPSVAVGPGLELCYE